MCRFNIVGVNHRIYIYYLYMYIYYIFIYARRYSMLVMLEKCVDVVNTKTNLLIPFLIWYLKQIKYIYVKLVKNI